MNDMLQNQMMPYCVSLGVVGMGEGEGVGIMPPTCGLLGLWGMTMMGVYGVGGG